VQIDPWARNNYNVMTNPLDYTDQYAPYAMTLHGLSLVSNGYLIGRITSWNPGENTRENVLVRELSHVTFGRPIDIAPGSSQGYTVTGTSGELWDGELEKRLMGDPDLIVFNDLMDQIKAFTVYEHWFKGVVPYRTWGYYGCWYNSKGNEPFTVDGETRVVSNFGFTYVSKRQTSA